MPTRAMLPSILRLLMVTWEEETVMTEFPLEFLRTTVLWSVPMRVMRLPMRMFSS